MSFDEEWAQHETQAADRATAMRLNQTPGSGGGAGPDLAHDESGKTSAVTYLRETLAPGTVTAGNSAAEDSAGVVGGSVPGLPEYRKPGLRGWETQEGLKTCMEQWQRAVAQLTKRLSSQATALSTANSLFGTNEDATGKQYLPGTSGPRSTIQDFQ